MIFTPEQKDDLLKFMIFTPGIYPDNFRVVTDDLMNQKELTLRQFQPLLDYFARLNFMKVIHTYHNSKIWYYPEAVDFLGRGGFVAQEEIFENNIKKLLLEIDNLKKELLPDRLETVNKIASIGNNILSGLSIITAAKLH